MKSYKILSLIVASIIVGTAAYGGRTPTGRIEQRTATIQEKDVAHAQAGEMACSSCNTATAQAKHGSRAKNHGVPKDSAADKGSDCMNMSDHESHDSGDTGKHISDHEGHGSGATEMHMDH